jgi:hypothetical protein
MTNYFSSAYFRNRTTQKKAAVYCLQGWCLALKAMEMLSEELLSENYKYVMTKRFNQDALENFFSQIRNQGGHRSHPTVSEFQASYQVVCLNVGVHSKKANCEDDAHQFLVDMAQFQQQNVNTETPNAEAAEYQIALVETAEANMILYPLQARDELQFTDKNVLYYIAGYVATKSGVKDCVNCELLLQNPDKSLTGADALLTYFKEYEDTDGSLRLTYPSESLASAVMVAGDVFRQNIFLMGPKDRVCSNLSLLVQSTVNFSWLDSHPEHTDVLRANVILRIVRVLINDHVNIANKNLRRVVDHYRLKKRDQLNPN